MEAITNNAFAFGVLLSFIISGLTFLIAGFFASTLPKGLRCPRCNIRVASVNVADTSDLSPPGYEYAQQDRLYIGRHVCSVCWEKMEQLGFSASGNWALGATVEYLKNNLSLIGVLIAVGALVVSILSLFTS